MVHLARQLIVLSGGRVGKMSPYDGARPLLQKILGLTEFQGDPRNIIKNNYTTLRAWMVENRQKGTTKGKAAKPKKALYAVETKTTKVKQTTALSVVSYINNSAIDPTLGDAFLRSFEWRALRMMALKKHGARCQCCGASPATGATMNVDHIKPRNAFPGLALQLDNLQVLCQECNHGKGNWDSTDWRPSDKAKDFVAKICHPSSQRKQQQEVSGEFSDYNIGKLLDCLR